MNIDKSISAFQEANNHIPGGVNSPARAFKGVGGQPLFISRASGSKIVDIDQHEYIDYVGSWGPMILGHNHPEVLKQIKKSLENGTSFGAPTLIETEMAQLIKQMVPSIEKIRMVNSGTEATMSALRLARGYTKKNLVVKFEGCYHGHGDSFLIKAGSGALTLGEPNSPGVTPGTAQDTLTAKFNDINSVEKLFSEKGNNIAAIIIEPITGNMGVVLPSKEFLASLRELCTKHGAMLIFDEVMTGFRISPGGAQQMLKITPDLTTFGKIIGGGLPVGAYGGKKEIMDYLAPEGPVYQAGTLSGNPIAMTAGYTTLKILNDSPDIYEKIEQKSRILEIGIRKNLDELGIPGVINRAGSMFTLFFTSNSEVNSYDDVMTCDTNIFGKYFRKTLELGVYIPPSQYEANFVSFSHTDEDIKKTIDINYKALKSL